MVYNIRAMNKQLFFISWKYTPNSKEAGDFVKDIEKLLDAAADLIYFISDLRRGRIIDTRIIQQLSALSEHPNWGGSSAFTQDAISKIFVSNFRRMIIKGQEKNSMFDRPEQALTFLESIEPGLTKDIPWNDLDLAQSGR